MTKTKKETIDEFIKDLQNIENLYKSRCVNWKGITSDTNEFYSEIIAHELLRDINKFDNISNVTRKETYYRENHCNIKIDICKSNRVEENFAKRLTGLTLENIGLIKDYQIPLKDTREDKGLGKIDLISFNEETKTMYLIELKYEGNSDTLLRASLESYTYYKIVDKAKLINDCFNSHTQMEKSEIIIKPAVIVVPKCQAYDELEEVVLGKRPELKALTFALGIKYFTVKLYANETIL